MSSKVTRWVFIAKVICILCLLMVFMPFHVHAMSGAMISGVSLPKRMDMESVSLDGTWNDYDFVQNTYAYCPVYLDSNGLLALKVQTYFEKNHLVYLLDSDMETIYYTTLYGEGAASPKTETFTYFLTAGQYYVRVQSYDEECSGAFRIKGVFSPAVTTEIEPNNTFDQAMGIIPNDSSIRGFLSTRLNANFIADPLPAGTQDFYDYYVFTVQASVWDVTISVLDVLNSTNKGFHIVLYDSSKNIIEEQYTGKTTIIERDFPTGTYYLLVEAANRGSGQYTISVTNTGTPPVDASIEIMDPFGPDSEYVEAEEPTIEVTETDEPRIETADPVEPDELYHPFFPAVEPDDQEETWDDESDDQEEEWDEEPESWEGWTPIVDDYDWLEESEDQGWFSYEEVEELINEELPYMDKLNTDKLPVPIIMSDDGHIYAMFCSTEQNAFTWMEAIEFCEYMCGHLATINSEGEQALLSALVQENGVNAWLGGYTTNNSWKWLTGEPFEEAWWYTGEPNGSGDSLQIYFNGQWDDTFNKNNSVTAFICEWE